MKILCRKFYHENLYLKQNLLNLENFNSQNFPAIWYFLYMICDHQQRVALNRILELSKYAMYVNLKCLLGENLAQSSLMLKFCT